MTIVRKRIYLTLWAMFMVLGVFSGLVFGQAIIRDHRVGEPDMALDVSHTGARAAESFRVWGKKRYRLFVSSVNHDPDRVGHRFQGTIAIVVLHPDGSEHFRSVYGPEAMDHVVPDNYGDTQLETLTLDGWPLRTWRIETRVLEPDPGFAGVTTHVKLWEDRPPVGMGGLISYVFLFPAIVSLALGLVFAGILLGQGIRWPLIVSAPITLVFATLLPG